MRVLLGFGIAWLVASVIWWSYVAASDRRRKEQHAAHAGVPDSFEAAQALPSTEEVSSRNIKDWFVSKASLGRRLWSSIKVGDEDAADVAEMEERLALASVLSQLILSSGTIEELCEGFAGELRKLVSLDWAALALINYSGSTVTVHPLSRKIPCRLDTEQGFPLAKTPMEWLAHNQAALLESDLSAKSDFDFDKSLIKDKVRSVVYMPLFSRRQVFGAFIAGSHQPEAYGDRELKLLKYAATQLATVAENRLIDRANGELAKRQAEFVSALAHELKTPLTPIRASSQILSEELNNGDADSRARLADNIRQSAQIMEQKLSNLLELARVESPDYRLDLFPSDITHVLERALVEMRETFRNNKQVCRPDVHELPMVRANAIQLRQVVLTMLGTASKLTPAGGSVHLHASRQGNEVVVEVTDTGSGFSQEELKHLFDVYDPVGIDRQRIPEIRMALALSKRLIELQRGRMWVESRPGKGSTFAFALPIAGLNPDIIW